ncbi:unnamed protein product, partial [Medioppia subpectinata]
MKIILLICLWIAGYGYGMQAGAEGTLWPYPQEVKIGETFFTITKQFNFTLKTAGKCDLLDKAIARYRKLFFLEDCSLVSESATETLFDGQLNVRQNGLYLGQIANITLSVHEKCETVPHMNMNEMYSININQQIQDIYAETVWGAIRALDTLSQLIRNVGQNQFAINETAILDFPRFAHRGLMLDTSRHYVPIKELLQNLDAMAYNKLNVFHWHIVDDQSFPYVSSIYPELSVKGAFNAKTHIFTEQQIQEVIAYGAERGIRVLVEFDSPGHTLSWGKGYPDLLTPCYSSGKPDGTYGPIDPSKNSSYKFIETLFKEVGHRFPDQYMHLGGDEVALDCWQHNPNIQSFMKANNFTTIPQLFQYYIENLLNIVRSLDKSYIVWQEVLDEGVVPKSDTIVHIWKDGWEGEMLNVTKRGFQTILSSCWYLNYINYGTDWPKYYACDPHNFGGTEQQNKLVIGGEACMWGT